ncbi:hypothetical protein AVEN_187564-1 [Araneus ventricosus]|uniref:Uncharacterized protein n=1 Tax=Araneus ventricosus TaxID=182803 RepID=A0A4Y2RCK8_ARAVE|nr:hypothetical protein AVEN_187564-1 [Araneus ventricosus]
MHWLKQKESIKGITPAKGVIILSPGALHEKMEKPWILGTEKQLKAIPNTGHHMREGTSDLWICPIRSPDEASKTLPVEAGLTTLEKPHSPACQAW